MNNQFATKLTNHFQNVHLVSLAAWAKASEITPCDRNGPYVVSQMGYDADDFKMTPGEFLLSSSGQWVALEFFYQMPIAERRAMFIFGTASEVMQILEDLPAKPVVIRPGGEIPQVAVAPENDDMLTAFQAAKLSQ